jgi:hypothetical protein
VERAHLTILNTVRTLLLESGLPDQFWAEAAYYAVYARNRSPSGPSKEIPEDLWRNYPVSISHQRPFGSNAFFRDHVETNKLRPRHRPGRLLSYKEGTVNYRIWDIESRKVVVSRDVTFEAQIDQPDLDTPTRATDFSSHHEVEEEEEESKEELDGPPEPVARPPPMEPRQNPGREARPSGTMSIRNLSRSTTQRPASAQEPV